MNTVIKMRFYGFVETTSNIWFLSRSFNALLCVDKVSGRIIKIKKIPYAKIEERNLWSYIFKNGNDLIAVPDKNDKIIIYHINSDDFSYISIKKHLEISSISNCRSAYKMDDDIIMLPNRMDKILIYNVKKKGISTIDIEDDCLNILYPNRQIQFRSQYEILEKQLFIPFVEAGAILVLDLITKQVQIKLVDGLNGCDTINYYKGIFYLASWNEKKIFALNMDLQIINEYVNFPDDFEGNNHIFAYSILIEDKILYFPQLANMIVSFNLRDKTIKEEMRLKTSSISSTNTYIAKSDNNKIISLMTEDTWLSTIFFSDKILYKDLYCDWDDIYNTKIIEDYLIENKYFNTVLENNEIGINLDIFIEKLKELGEIKSYTGQLNQNNLIGKQIYKFIIEE